MKKLFTLVAFLLLSPSLTYAFTRTYTCTDLPSGSATCVGSTITFTASNENKNNSAIGIDMPDGVPGYYISYHSSGSGTGKIKLIGNATETGTIDFISGDAVDQPLDAAGFSGNSWTAVFITDNSSYTGTVDTLCISDTLGACGGGGGGSGDATIDPYDGATTSTPDQVEQNLFNAFIVFFATFFFIVWFFKRKM